MIFSSTIFLFIFLPINLLLYYVIPKKLLTVRNLLLLCTSLLFYSWGEPLIVFVMLLSISANYGFGLWIDKVREDKVQRKLSIILTLVFNIGLLGYFKYFNFFVDNINGIFGTGFASQVALPIGISFYTFQIMSYIIDIYFGNVKAQKNLFTLALYISFFPQLIAGPIVRYIDVETQFANRTHNLEKIASGFQRFIVGLSKKILIANQVSIFADHAFNAASLTSVMAWTGAVCYALQIYFDFSGYSDMAIGLAKMFGFDFLENFRYPYIADTVQNFCRRWHISLSNWFRDYLYIPLGGNRKGALRTYLNLLIVFAVTGLWHGASWSFVIWGLYHGAFLMLERGVWGKVLKKLPSVLTWFYTMIIVMIGWVLFRAESLTQAIEYIKNMFNFSTGGLAITLANLDIVIVLAIAFGIIFSAPILPYVKKKLFGDENHFMCENLTVPKQIASYASILGCFCMLVMSIIFLTGSDFNPFLYFRF